MKINKNYNSLLHIDAPHFCAGAIVERGKIKKAAPIIRYMKGWSPTKVHEYCKKKQWKSYETNIYYNKDLIEF